MASIAHLDYETRSRADLKAVGSYRYACDSSTEVLMAAVSAGNAPESPVYLWVNPKYPGRGQNKDALRVLAASDTIYAHSVGFEVPITEMAPGDKPLTGFSGEWRCTSAMARVAGLPSDLKGCAETLGLVQRKDARGKALIRLFSVPDDWGVFVDPRDHPREWQEFCDYCVQDVVVEKEIHRALGAFELRGEQLETFRFDLRMNRYGVPVNVPGLRAAQRVVDRVQDGANKEFLALTGVNVTRRSKVQEWLKNRGFDLPDMQAKTIDLYLAHAKKSDSADVFRALELYRSVSYAAVKKVQSMLNYSCPDGRIRGVFRFYGAGPGRWASTGPQIQNAKKPSKAMRKIADRAYRHICGGVSEDLISEAYGDPLEVISSCVRNFVHDVGFELLDGDYNAIEARILCWLAGQEDILELWRQVDAGDESKHPYKVMASQIYAVHPLSVTDDQRQLGKQAELGCGYQMGSKKFRDTCMTYGIELSQDLADTAVSVYRDTHDRVVSYWSRLDSDAKRAIRAKGREFGEFVVREIAGIEFLLCRLPSGRRIAYPRPRIDAKEYKDKSGALRAGEQITYWGELPATVSWGRVGLYGGKLAENIDQGTAADLMSHGARVAEIRGMMPFALIHDQALARRSDGQTAAAFAAALADLPPWATGLPLKVEAKVAPYYRK
jgi:DNA polymerase